MLYSSLLAQLVANAKYNRFNDTDNWYNETMANLGWVTQSFGFDQYESPSELLTIFKVTQELLSGLMGDEKELMRTLEETLDSLAKTTSSNEFSLFDSNSISRHNGNFQFFVCDVDKANQINVAGLYSYFSVNKGKKNSLFTPQRKQDMALFNSTTILTLNEQLYAVIRDEVKHKLGERADKLVQKTESRNRISVGVA